MRSFFSSVLIADPSATLGHGGIVPPGGGGGGNGENSDCHHDSPSFAMRLRRARLGLLVGLAGILMIFVSFTSAYIVRRGLPTFDPKRNSLVRDWLPVRFPGILLTNTFVLVISSVTMEITRRQAAHTAALAPTAPVRAIALGAPKGILWPVLTLVLGLTFLRGQWLAWRQLTASGFDVAASPSSSFVYVLTGMHGLHLLGGILAFLVAATAIVMRRPAESRLVVLDVTSWYWHSMTALWIYILCLLKFGN